MLSSQGAKRDCSHLQESPVINSQLSPLLGKGEKSSCQGQSPALQGSRSKKNCSPCSYHPQSCCCQSPSPCYGAYSDDKNSYFYLTPVPHSADWQTGQAEGEGIVLGIGWGNSHHCLCEEWWELAETAKSILVVVAESPQGFQKACHWVIRFPSPSE